MATWLAMDGLARHGQRRPSMVGHGSTFLFSVTASVGQLPAEAKFGQPRLAKIVFDLITDVLWSRAPQALIKIVEEKPSTTGSDQDGALLCMPGIERSWLQPWRAEDDDLMACVYENIKKHQRNP